MTWECSKCGAGGDDGFDHVCVFDDDCVEDAKHDHESVPICIYARDDENVLRASELHFYEGYKYTSFDEFCLYIIIPRIRDLQGEWPNVRWGAVYDRNESVDEYEKTLKRLIDG